MLKWLIGRRRRGGKSPSVDLAFALIFYTDVLVLWYISDKVFLLYRSCSALPFDVISNRECSKHI